MARPSLDPLGDPAAVVGDRDVGLPAREPAPHRDAAAPAAHEAAGDATAEGDAVLQAIATRPDVARWRARALAAAAPAH